MIINFNEAGRIYKELRAQDLGLKKEMVEFNRTVAAD